MDDTEKLTSQTTDHKNVLPDVVHSQQIPTMSTVEGDETESVLDTGQTTEGAKSKHIEDDGETESISEHVPSEIEYSVSVSDNIQKRQTSHDLNIEKDRTADNSSNILPPQSNTSNIEDTSKLSWNVDIENNAHLSKESPVNLTTSIDTKSLPLHTENKQGELENEGRLKSDLSEQQQDDKMDEVDSPKESLCSEYLDSLNEDVSQDSYSTNDNNMSDTSKNFENKAEGSPRESSESEEIIKLDIRGHGVPKFPMQAAKIIFGPPPEGSMIIESQIDPIPAFQNLLSPFLVGSEGVKVEEIYDEVEEKRQQPSENSPVESLSSDKTEKDLLIEEMTVENAKEKDVESPIQLKSMPVEETISLSTMTTDYKTICEEYQEKLVYLEDAMTRRDELIAELTVSLQRSVQERDQLKHDNNHLVSELQHLQHATAETPLSEHDTVKAQLSDFVKYQSMVKDDSTKFYSAVMSGTTSLQSSNGEKDIDREEITVNYSKSDLRSSDTDDFENGFEVKVVTLLNKFEEYIEENLRNKLRESIIQVLCDEISKMRIEFDTEMKEMEAQLQQDKQAYSIETRRLRELLACVKAGNADIDALREELSIKHEKEMENLRTYFEKKCSDMERSYSEEVWRGRACASPPSGAASECLDAAAGDCRRRTRSAEFPSLTYESTPMEQLMKQLHKKYEQQSEELRAEHAQRVAALEEQVKQLKAHIQSAETDGNVSIYPQDIDLELEKDAVESRLEEVRQEVLDQIQEQIKVLLSDPDAELSSWPLELVALRDRIHGDARALQDKEVPSLREEAPSAAETDKWRQRRYNSFDQNRQLEEVTKERDALQRVAASLQRCVGQLVAYCASAEDELNRTVLARLLATLLPDEQSFVEECGRGSVGGGSLDSSLELETSAVGAVGGAVGAVGARHVHFAPELGGVLAALDEAGAAGFLQHQRDLSADIKRELEHSLRRLRHEAHDLLDLSVRLAANKRNPETRMLESSQVEIKELEDEPEEKQKSCDNCELHKKSMEEAMSECLQREGLLRADLDAAMVKIATLITDREHSDDVIAEGYGTCASAERRACAGVTRSLEEASPRGQLHALAHDLDLLQRERDDLHQQTEGAGVRAHSECCLKLEAAHRQLRATRQFVEEQAAEREHERDEFARRLHDARDDNQRLLARLQTNARILAEMHELRAHCCHRKVEQLEAQTRDMNQIITDLEAKKTNSDEELKSYEEKVVLLRDIIANLESQLEQKNKREADILQQLESMQQTIEDRDSKMRALLGELESLKNEKVDQSEVVCENCNQEEHRYKELLENVTEQCRWLEAEVLVRARLLQQAHEQTSACCSEPSEDVSLRDKAPLLQERGAEPQTEWVCALALVREAVRGLARAEDAALKRVADLRMQRDQLRDVAQEVRAERDVLQARMSEQALRISSLSARLTRQRHDADALAHAAHSQLGVQLHDANAEVQRLKEELETKDKQLARLKLNLEDKNKAELAHYGDTGSVKEVSGLERELAAAQQRGGQLQAQVVALAADNRRLQLALARLQHGDLVLKLDGEDRNQRSERGEGDVGHDGDVGDEGDVGGEGKASARTLSDIVSISEFDEQDLQMRRAELRPLGASPPAAPHAAPHGPTADKSAADRTLPPELRHHMSSLHLDPADRLDLCSLTPRADSLPAHLTSTQRVEHYKRNVNETTVFGDHKPSPINIIDNCSLYPNRDISDSRNVSVEPKKIDFSLETTDNKTKEEFTSLGELGITLDVRQENFPDILTQLKHEVKKARNELESCKSELKNAEEQLCEFPALKEEVDELKALLENTMATMEKDKKFYENQLENFSTNKKQLEQRLTELTQEVSDKSKDLHLLKEDILRRENMILELAKEKRNLTNRLNELETKVDELQNRNEALLQYEMETHTMKEKIKELEKLEQLVSEKNQQIDSLNQHLDRLDDMQRNLNDKTEELENLKVTLHQKTKELYQVQATVSSLTHDMDRVSEENNELNNHNKELKLNMSKLEKEQENASLKLQNSENELERLNSINNELSSKIEELKLINDQLKDKETEIETLNEDINVYHSEICALKEQLEIVSRSPSPGAAQGREQGRELGREQGGERRAALRRLLPAVRKQVSLLQHELDFNKKELNCKVFELAKAKLDVSELKSTASQAAALAADKEAQHAELARQVARLQADLHQLTHEKHQLSHQLDMLVARLREESNVSEIKAKLREKAESCHELEMELHDMRECVDRRGAARSPTAELERALRDQLHYSNALDEHIMDQILSASSEEHEEIPRLALNTSKSSSSIASTSSDRACRLRAQLQALQLQVEGLQARLQDKDALIAELNRIRDKLVQDWQTVNCRYEAERDNSGRLQLLLDAQKDTAESLQNQDSNMIQILKKRLESAMQSEGELLEREQRLRRRLAELEAGQPAPRDHAQLEAVEKLKGEVSVLRSKLECERARADELSAQLQLARTQLEERARAAADLRAQLAQLKRTKYEAGVELARHKELVGSQAAAVAHLERQLAAAAAAALQRSPNNSLTEIESQKGELAREIATLRKCLQSEHPELSTLRAERQRLQAELHALRRQLDARAATPPPHAPPPHSDTPHTPRAQQDKDQAIRYLHGRCVRLESWRKALVWQKRYLQRVLAGYASFERGLAPRAPHAAPRPAPRPRGKKLFKCVVTVVITVLRMGYVVRRRHAARSASACLLRPAHLADDPAPASHASRLNLMSTPAVSPRCVLSRRLKLAPTPAPHSPLTPLAPHLPQSPQSPRVPHLPHPPHPPHTPRVPLLPQSPLTAYGALTPLASRAVEDDVKKTPGVSTPRNEFYLMSSPRGDVASAYMSKLEAVSRCLNHVLDSPRDVP